ncbi:MAG: hypothetical protein ACOH2Q_03615 [Rhodococcus sp. (in: high G+C Gram-positive bacteria)]
MTSTTKSDRVRSTTGTAASALLGAASAASKGPAGVGLVVAKQGYGLARKHAAQRRAANVARSAETKGTTPLLAAPSGSRKTRRIVVIGAAAAVVAGVVFFLGRRRSEVPPPADVPPSLTDYDDASS